MVGASSVHSPRSPVLCVFSLYSFLLHLIITPPLFWSSYISVSTHCIFHFLITSSSSVFLSSWPNPDLPTFYEIKAEDLPPLCTNPGRFLGSENIAIFYLPVTQNDPIFSVSTSPNTTEITKLVLDNNTSNVYVFYLL